MMLLTQSTPVRNEEGFRADAPRMELMYIIADYDLAVEELVCGILASRLDSESEVEAA
jgi:hypothetical protein